MGVENESVVGLPSLVGFFRKSPTNSLNMGKLMEIKCLFYPLFRSYVSQITSSGSLSSLHSHWNFASVEQKTTFILPVNEELTAVYQAVQCATVTF